MKQKSFFWAYIDLVFGIVVLFTLLFVLIPLLISAKSTAFVLLGLALLFVVTPCFVAFYFRKYWLSFQETVKKSVEEK